MAEIICLDWGKDKLFGWEPEKSIAVVEAIVEGIDEGADFPPVAVHRLSENVYCISPLRETPDGLSDGGHYRAIGHYIRKKPLKCELLEGLPPIPKAWEVPIEKIELVPDSGQYSEHEERFSSYALKA